MINRLAGIWSQKEIVWLQTTVFNTALTIPSKQSAKNNTIHYLLSSQQTYCVPGISPSVGNPAVYVTMPWPHKSHFLLENIDGKQIFEMLVYSQYLVSWIPRNQGK